MHSRIFVVVLILLSLPISGSILAQSHWWYPETGSTVTFEWERPHYDASSYWDNGHGILNGLAFLGGRYQFADGFTVLWEFPFASSDVKNASYPIYYDCFNGDCYPIYETDQSSIGNPMFGVEQNVNDNSVFLRTTVRVPLFGEDKWRAARLGINAAFDRFEAFNPKVWTIRLDCGWRTAKPEQPLRSQIMFGLSSLIPSEGDVELLLDLNGYLGVAMRRVSFGGFLATRYWMTEEYASFSDQLFSSAGVIARTRFGRFEPGLQLRVNLKEAMRNYIDYTYGLNVAVRLGSAKQEASEDW